MEILLIPKLRERRRRRGRELLQFYLPVLMHHRMTNYIEVQGGILYYIEVQGGIL